METVYQWSFDIVFALNTNPFETYSINYCSNDCEYDVNGGVMFRNWIDPLYNCFPQSPNIANVWQLYQFSRSQFVFWLNTIMKCSGLNVYTWLHMLIYIHIYIPVYIHSNSTIMHSIWTSHSFIESFQCWPLCLFVCFVEPYEWDSLDLSPENVA